MLVCHRARHRMSKTMVDFAPLSRREDNKISRHIWSQQARPLCIILRSAIHLGRAVSLKAVGPELGLSGRCGRAPHSTLASARISYVST